MVKNIFQMNTTCNYQKSHFECKVKTIVTIYSNWRQKESPVTGRQIITQELKRLMISALFSALSFIKLKSSYNYRFCHVT